MPTDQTLLDALSQLVTITKGPTGKVLDVSYERTETLHALQYLGRQLIQEDKEMALALRQGDDAGGCRKPFDRTVFLRLSSWSLPSGVLMPLFFNVHDDDFELLACVVGFFTQLLLPPQENAAERGVIFRFLSTARAVLTHSKLLQRLKELLLRLIEKRGLSQDGSGGLSVWEQRFITATLNFVVSGLRLPDLPDAMGASDDMFDRILTAMEGAKVLDILQLIIHQNITDPLEKQHLKKHEENDQTNENESQPHNNEEAEPQQHPTPPQPDATQYGETQLSLVPDSYLMDTQEAGVGETQALPDIFDSADVPEGGGNGGAGTTANAPPVVLNIRPAGIEVPEATPPPPPPPPSSPKPSNVSSHSSEMADLESNEEKEEDEESSVFDDATSASTESLAGSSVPERDGMKRDLNDEADGEDAHTKPSVLENLLTRPPAAILHSAGPTLLTEGTMELWNNLVLDVFNLLFLNEDFTEQSGFEEPNGTHNATPLAQSLLKERQNKLMSVTAKAGTFSGNFGRQGFFVRNNTIIRAEALNKGGIEEPAQRVTKKQLHATDQEATTHRRSQRTRHLLFENFAFLCSDPAVCFEPTERRNTHNAPLAFPTGFGAAHSILDEIIQHYKERLFEEDGQMAEEERAFLTNQKGNAVDEEDEEVVENKVRNMEDGNLRVTRFLRFSCKCLNFVRGVSVRQNINGVASPLNLSIGGISKVLSEKILGRAFDLSVYYYQLETGHAQCKTILKTLKGATQRTEFRKFQNTCVEFLKEAFTFASSLLETYKPKEGQDATQGQPTYLAARSLCLAVLHDQSRIRSLFNFVKTQEVSKNTSKYRSDLLQLVHVIMQCLAHVERDGKIYLTKKRYRKATRGTRKRRRVGSASGSGVEESDTEMGVSSASGGEEQERAADEAMIVDSENDSDASSDSMVDNQNDDPTAYPEALKEALRFPEVATQHPHLCALIEEEEEGFVESHPGLALLGVASVLQASQRSANDALSSAQDRLLGCLYDGNLQSTQKIQKSQKTKKTVRIAPIIHDDEASESADSYESVLEDRETRLNVLWEELLHPRAIQTYADTLKEWQDNSDETNACLAFFLQKVAVDMRCPQCVLTVELLTVYESILQTVALLRRSSLPVRTSFDLLSNVATLLVRKWFAIQRHNKYWVAMSLVQCTRFEANLVAEGDEALVLLQDLGSARQRTTPFGERLDDVPPEDGPNDLNEMHLSDGEDAPLEGGVITARTEKNTAKLQRRQWTAADDRTLCDAWQVYIATHKDGFIGCMKQKLFKDKVWRDFFYKPPPLGGSVVYKSLYKYCHKPIFLKFR